MNIKVNAYTTHECWIVKVQYWDTCSLCFLLLVVITWGSLQGYDTVYLGRQGTSFHRNMLLYRLEDLRNYIPPKYWHLVTKLHNVTSLTTYLEHTYLLFDLKQPILWMSEVFFFGMDYSINKNTGWVDAHKHALYHVDSICTTVNYYSSLLVLSLTLSRNI